MTISVEAKQEKNNQQNRIFLIGLNKSVIF